MSNSRLLLSLLLGLVVRVFYAETGERAIDTNREELAVIVVKAHPFDLLRVCLHFEHLFDRLIRVTEDLNRAWAVRFS